MHDRDELGVIPDCRRECRQIKQPGMIGVKPAYLESLFLECTANIRNRLVLGRHRDQVPAPVGTVSRGASNREIVGFGRTRCPDQVPGVATKQGRQLASGTLDMCDDAPARSMCGRRICTLVEHQSLHCLDDPWIHGRRRRVVEIHTVSRRSHESISRSRSTAVRMPRSMFTSF